MKTENSRGWYGRKEGRKRREEAERYGEEEGEKVRGISSRELSPPPGAQCWRGEDNIVREERARNLGSNETIPGSTAC